MTEVPCPTCGGSGFVADSSAAAPGGPAKSRTSLARWREEEPVEVASRANSSTPRAPWCPQVF